MPDLAAASAPNVMDQHYRYQRLVYDKTRRHFLIGRQHLIGALNPNPGESVLEIGCGTAWNLTQVASRYPDADLYGVDLSQAMLDTASRTLRRRKLSKRIALAQGNATSFDPKAAFGRDRFDHIFFSYALSMIPEWVNALDHALNLLAPHGTLHCVDFGQCDDLPKSFKRALFAFLAHHKVTPRGNLEAEVARLTKLTDHRVRVKTLHRGYTSHVVVTPPGNLVFQ